MDESVNPVRVILAHCNPPVEGEADISVPGTTLTVGDFSTLTPDGSGIIPIVCPTGMNWFWWAVAGVLAWGLYDGSILSGGGGRARRARTPRTPRVRKPRAAGRPRVRKR